MEILQQIFDAALFLWDFIIHIDIHLNTLIAWAGPWVYVVLFVIVFAETGIVVTPFLPGDSLLFALGALTTVDNAVLSLTHLYIVLLTAAILGDTANYWIGYHVANRIQKTKLINKEHLEKTQKFYDKYGGKTIIIARFVPIVRTFAPFVAGVGRMSYGKFMTFNVVGAVAWVTIFLFAGHFFGNIPAIKRNFTLVVFVIIGVSLLPIAVEWWRARRPAQKGA